MSILIRNLANTSKRTLRPRTLDPILTVSQSKGRLSVTAATLIRMNIRVVEGEEDKYLSVGVNDSNGKVYVFQGHINKEEGIKVGSKLNPIGATQKQRSNANVFFFSSIGVWEDLGGNTKRGIKYTVSDTVLEVEGVKYFELVGREELDSIILKQS